MGNPFDGLTAAAFNTVANTMGYQATWIPASGPNITAQVLYNDVTGEAKLGEKKFGIDNWKIEYKDTDMPALKTLVNANSKEVIEIALRGITVTFNAIEATPCEDGVTTVLKLRLKP